MIVTIVTLHLATRCMPAETTKTFESTAPKYRAVLGLLRKNDWVSKDVRRAGRIYVWASRVDADRTCTQEWKKFVADKYGAPAGIEYLHSPVMVDNREGTLGVAA